MTIATDDWKEEKGDILRLVLSYVLVTLATNTDRYSRVPVYCKVTHRGSTVV